METSLRHGGDHKSLGIHVKNRYPFPFGTVFQVHGELDTKTGDPTYGKAILRKLFPSLFLLDLPLKVGLGLQYDPCAKFRYIASGKIAFPEAANGLLRFNIKGFYDIDEDFKEFEEKKPVAAAEFTWGILDFPKDQEKWIKVGCQVSIKTKVGYEVEFSDPVPYLRIRGNKWTLKTDINGKWNVSYYL